MLRQHQVTAGCFGVELAGNRLGFAGRFLDRRQSRNQPIDDVEGQQHRIGWPHHVDHDRDVQLVPQHLEHLAGTADHAAWMMQNGQAAVFSRHQSEAIACRSPVADPARRTHAGPGLGVAHLWRRQVLQPQQHVVDGGCHVAFTVHGPAQQPFAPAALRVGQVVGGAVGQTGDVMRPTQRVVHAHGLQDAFVQLHFERRAANSFHHLVDQRESTIAV